MPIGDIFTTPFTPVLFSSILIQNPSPDSSGDNYVDELGNKYVDEVGAYYVD